jgi:hypothetical protein
MGTPKSPAVVYLPRALNPYSPEGYVRATKPYHAVVGVYASPEPAKHVTVYAGTLDEARQVLEAQDGSGMIICLWVDGGWQLPREH